jgi:predicted RNase H-like nuclease
MSNSRDRLQRGPDLPYKLVAGVEPVRRGWLVVSAKLQGPTLAPHEAAIYKRFVDILDHKPAFTVIAVHAPIGLLDRPRRRGRECDREARRLLGWPHLGAIATPPAWSQLPAPPPAARKKGSRAPRRAPARVTPVTQRIRRIAEVNREMQPYWQRTVYEVNPELSFYHLNGEHPMPHSKRSLSGIEERYELLATKLPNFASTLEQEIAGATPLVLMDAVADLWTARRIAAKAAIRLPLDPQWDPEGLRMEIVL